MGVDSSTMIYLLGSEGHLGESSSTVDIRDWLPYPVVQSIERFGARLQGRQFAAGCHTGDTKEIFGVCTRRMHDTAVGAWTKQWWNQGGRNATDLHCHFRNNGSPFSRLFEEAGYVWLICYILGHLQRPHFSIGLVIWLGWLSCPSLRLHIPSSEWRMLRLRCRLQTVYSHSKSGRLREMAQRWAVQNSAYASRAAVRWAIQMSGAFRVFPNFCLVPRLQFWRV